LTSSAPIVANPLLLELPHELAGRRLIARPYRDGDGSTIATAVAESRSRLIAAGMPWVKEWDDPDCGTLFVRRCQAKWAARDELIFGLWDLTTSTYIGGSGLHRIVWAVPSFEVGYWVRDAFEGKGLISEATALIATFAFDELGAQRVRIRCDARNARSAAIPRRLGFVHEATLRNECRSLNGELRDTFEFGMTPDDFHTLRDGAWRGFLSP